MAKVTMKYASRISENFREFLVRVEVSTMVKDSPNGLNSDFVSLGWFASFDWYWLDSCSSYVL